MDAEDAQKYPGPHVKIDGAVYPLPENFTFRESQWVKKLTGLRAGDFLDALGAGDNDFALAYAAVAMARGTDLTQTQIERILLDKSVGDVEIDFRDAEEQKADAEGEKRPPDEPAEAGDESPTPES